MKPDNIKQWLASSQCNVPYELDFFTPFKEMVAPEDSYRKVNSKRKHHAGSLDKEKSYITTPSSEDDASSSASSSTHKYKRRPRHKTREDRYEYKGSKPRAAKRGAKDEKEDEKRHKKQKRRTKKDVANHFVAQNVASERLTLNKPAGLFRRGKASAPISRPGLADLSFSERAFLKLNQDSNQGGRGDRPVQDDEQYIRPARRHDKRRQEQDAKMSQYFRQPLQSHNTGDGRQEPMAPRNGPRNHLSYRTPCRQRQQSSELSSSALANLELPGAPYLGFGEPGPGLENPSHPTKGTRSISHVSNSKLGSPAEPDEEQEVNEATSLSESSRQNRSSTVFTADPRAMHSPTSNFKFARLQHARRTRQGRELSDVAEEAGTVNVGSKQDEILELLRELQRQQKQRIGLGGAEQVVTEECHDKDQVTPEKADDDSKPMQAGFAEQLMSLKNVESQEDLLNGLEALLDTARNGIKSGDNATPREADEQKKQSQPPMNTADTGGHARQVASQAGPNESQIDTPIPEPHSQRPEPSASRTERSETRPVVIARLVEEVNTTPLPHDHVSSLEPNRSDIPVSRDFQDDLPEPVSLSGSDALPEFGTMQSLSRSTPRSSLARAPPQLTSLWPSIYEQQACVTSVPQTSNSIGLPSPATTTPRPLTACPTRCPVTDCRETAPMLSRPAVWRNGPTDTCSSSSYLPEHVSIFHQHNPTLLRPRSSYIQTYRHPEGQDEKILQGCQEQGLEPVDPLDNSADDRQLDGRFESANIMHRETLNNETHPFVFTAERFRRRGDRWGTIVEAPSDMASFWRPNMLY